MAPVRAARLALLLAAVAAEAQDADTEYPPLDGLKRVIVLARHGNRAPNPQIEMLCPNFAKHVLPGFKVAPAALSRVGMAENEENGEFIRHRYGHFIPEGPYKYDGSYAFFSERAERNVVSTLSFARGMFPAGTGLEGFAADRPNMVPISTTQDGADVIMNCPRDGPCQHALAKDVMEWTQEHAERAYSENKELFEEISKACGYDMLPGRIVYEGKSKPITWAAKAVMDAFSFALNEGLDATMGGRLSLETIQKFHHKVEAMVQDSNFGKPHQLTYWAGDFIPTVLQLARMPMVDEVNKFHLFLNHRELLYAVARLLTLPLEFPDQPPGAVPAGSSLIMEVYEEGVRLFFWTPSRPALEIKAKYLKEGLPLSELYTHGTLIPVEPKGCSLGHLCPVEQLVLHFVHFVQRTGTYVDICNVSLEDTYFARGEASLGIMEEWVQPILAAEPPSSAKSAFKTARREATALGARPRTGEQAAGFSLTALVTASAVFAAAAGSVGFAAGRRMSKDPAADSAYLSLS